jgi:hypothetical protein
MLLNVIFRHSFVPDIHGHAQTGAWCEVCMCVLANLDFGFAMFIHDDIK